jgi:hypothetical protein
LHDHVLALADDLAFRFDDRLQEMEIFHVSAVCLDAVTLGIVLKNGTNCLSF